MNFRSYVRLSVFLVIRLTEVVRMQKNCYPEIKCRKGVAKRLETNAKYLIQMQMIEVSKVFFLFLPNSV